MSTEPSRLREPSSFAGAGTSDAVDATRERTPPGGNPAANEGPDRVTRSRTRGDDTATSSRRARTSPPPRRKRKARKVHRVVHHLEIWSVAKVASIFAACAYAGGMISGYLLWQAAERVGTIDGIEGFIESSAAYDSFEILGGVVFRVAVVTGLVLGFVAVAIAVLGALLFNLISDLAGGIRMTVIDEDLIVAPARRPGRPDTDRS